MKISFKLTLLMFALSVFAVGAVGVTLLARSRSTISGLAPKYSTSINMVASSQVSTFLET
jgi:hypothetical protein